MNDRHHANAIQTDADKAFEERKKMALDGNLFSPLPI